MIIIFGIILRLRLVPLEKRAPGPKKPVKRVISKNKFKNKIISRVVIKKSIVGSQYVFYNFEKLFMHKRKHTVYENFYENMHNTLPEITIVSVLTINKIKYKQ